MNPDYMIPCPQCVLSRKYGVTCSTRREFGAVSTFSLLLTRYVGHHLCYVTLCPMTLVFTAATNTSSHFQTLIGYHN